MAALAVPSFSPAALEYSNFLLYETRARYYLVSYTRDKSAWRVMKISRMEAHDFEVCIEGWPPAWRRAQALTRLGAGVGRPGSLHGAAGCGFAAHHR